MNKHLKSFIWYFIITIALALIAFCLEWWESGGGIDLRNQWSLIIGRNFVIAGLFTFYFWLNGTIRNILNNNRLVILQHFVFFVFIVPLLYLFLKWYPPSGQSFIDYAEANATLIVGDFAWYYLLLAMPFTIYFWTGIAIKKFLSKQLLLLMVIIAPMIYAFFIPIYGQITGSGGDFTGLGVILIFPVLHLIAGLILGIIFYFVKFKSPQKPTKTG